jgi:hypothetical protein
MRGLGIEREKRLRNSTSFRRGLGIPLRGVNRGIALVATPRRRKGCAASRLLTPRPGARGGVRWAAANQVPPDKLSLCGQPARQRSCVQAGRRRGAKFICRHGLQAMSIHKAIDQIVEAFIPEMERISRMDEGEEQKERHYKAWLRATLQKFADDVREIEARNEAERSRDHHAA